MTISAVLLSLLAVTASVPAGLPRLPVEAARPDRSSFGPVRSRSNQALANEIASRLVRGGFRSYDVEIMVRGGHVLLRGHVRNSADREGVAQFANSCLGVRSVENRLRVVPEAPVVAEKPVPSRL